MPRPLVATIHEAAMHHNLEIARRKAPNARTWAVVKANAYGHGLESALRAFDSADGMALIETEAALELRERGWTRPILLLEGFFDASDVPLLARYGIASAIHNDEQIAMLEAAKLREPVDVHLKMNTGMNRLGFLPEKFGAAWQRLRALPCVRNIAFMTHFANADDAFHDKLTLGEQVRRFKKGTAGLSGEINIHNSAATLMHADVPGAWVRPGIMLYGASPGGSTAEAFGLLPAMTLASSIIAVQQIAAGEAIGYGSRFVADRRMMVGVVACGYADGYPRHAPDGTPVLVDGVRTRVLGRVSMDMLMVDLTAVPGAGLGSRVVLWGEGLSIDEVALAAGTLGYELMCALAPRVRVIRQIEQEHDGQA